MNQTGHTRSSQIIGLVGSRGAGKTTLLQTFLETLAGNGVTFSGILSPGLFERGDKVAIAFERVPSGERSVFARRYDSMPGDFQFGDWAFFSSAFDWANRYLESMPAADLLILDEIGPLELELGRGLQAGLKRLSEGRYALALVTLRPKCEEAFGNRFPDSRFIRLSDHSEAWIGAEMLRLAKNLSDASQD
jgi:nucleoside-triphosphatase THEP1